MCKKHSKNTDYVKKSLVAATVGGIVVGMLPSLESATYKRTSGGTDLLVDPA